MDGIFRYQSGGCGLNSWPVHACLLVTDVELDVNKVNRL